MAIQFECSDCGKSLRVKDEFAGKKLRCPECETVLKIPEADDGEAEFYDDDEEQEQRASRRTPTARASKSNPKSKRSGPDRKQRANGGENYFRRSTTKTKKPKTADNKAVLIWSIVIGGGVLGLAGIGTVVMIVMNMGGSSGPQAAVAAPGQQPTAAAKNNSQYVTAETNTPVSKFKMIWDMPAKWTQQSGVEDGFWPWAEMKGQGQTIKISSNRSLTEASSTMTSMGGFEESLKTAHTVRLAKLKLEYNDFEEGPLNIHKGKYGPVVWSEYEYKGMFGKGYGIRCTVPGPRLPCTVVMEYALSARDKWRPVVLDIAGSVHFKRSKSDDGGGDDDFFLDVGGDMGDVGGPPDAGNDMPADQGEVEPPGE